MPPSCTTSLARVGDADGAADALELGEFVRQSLYLRGDDRFENVVAQNDAFGRRIVGLLLDHLVAFPVSQHLVHHFRHKQVWFLKKQRMTPVPLFGLLLLPLCMSGSGQLSSGLS